MPVCFSYRCVQDWTWSPIAKYISSLRLKSTKHARPRLDCFASLWSAKHVCGFQAQTKAKQLAFFLGTTKFGYRRLFLCPGLDLNQHGITPTTPSR